MSYANAQLAIEKKLAEAFGDDLPVQWPNGPTIHPGGAVHAVVYHMQARTSVDTLGEGGRDVVPGLTQVDYYVPLQSGGNASAAFVDTMRAAFIAGKWVTEDGQSVLITSCGPGPAKRDGIYFKSIVDIQWEARLTR